MVFRVYVEKKHGFDVEARQLARSVFAVAPSASEPSLITTSSAICAVLTITKITAAE